MIRNVKVIHKTKISIYIIYLCYCFSIGIFFSCFNGFFGRGSSFLGRIFYSWKITKLLQDKKKWRIKRKNELKNLPFHTFIYFRLYVNVFYANMKVPFEIVQVVLSRNHPIRLFLGFLSKDFYKVPTDKPVGKWRLKATPNSTFGSWGNLGGYILKAVSYRCSGLTYEGSFKNSNFLMNFYFKVIAASWTVQLRSSSL